MIKKTVTYTNYKGEEKTEEVYFHLKPEVLTDMLAEMGDDIGVKLTQAAEEEDIGNLVKYFKWMLERAYGVVSEDGEEFEQSPELWEKFRRSAKYDAVFSSIAFDEEGAEAFMRGIFPPDIVAKLGI